MSRNLNLYQNVIPVTVRPRRDLLKSKLPNPPRPGRWTRIWMKNLSAKQIPLRKQMEVAPLPSGKGDPVSVVESNPDDSPVVRRWWVAAEAVGGLGDGQVDRHLCDPADRATKPV